MSNNFGTLGLYQWFPEHGEHLIFSNDIEKFQALLPNGKVFHCINEDKDFLILCGLLFHSPSKSKYRIKINLHIWDAPYK